jgi:hypothetical protein
VSQANLCGQCRGTGTWTPPNQKGTVHGYKCPGCCKHEKGRWQLVDHYGKDNGKWCCTSGCGKLWEHPDDLRDAIAAVLSSTPRAEEKSY